MSVAMLTAVKGYQTTPTAKAVLVAMADYAGDDGRCWPSMARLCEFTCLSERAVRNAVRELEKSGVVVSERASGRTSHYLVCPQIARTTPAPDAGLKDDEPRQQMPPAPSAAPAGDAGTQAPDAAEPRHEMPVPRHDVPPNHQEPPKQPPRTTKPPAVAELSIADLVADGIEAQLAADFIAHRKTKKAKLTQRAWNGLKAEAMKAGWPLSAAVEKVITRNWQTFEAGWVTGHKGPAKSTAVHIGQQDYSAGWGK